MSFGGSVSAMIKSLKDNRSLLERNGKFKSNNRNGIYSDKKEDKLEFKEVSEEELFLIKKRIHENLRKQKRKQVNILLFSILTTIIILTIVFH